MTPKTLSILAITSIGIPLFVSAQEPFPLDPSWNYPVDTKDTAAPGFAGRVVQARGNAELSATIARGNAHLEGRRLLLR